MNESKNIWIHRLYCQCLKNKGFSNMMNVVINNMHKIACIDTEFFVGKYEYTNVTMPNDIGLYNVGIATTKGKNGKRKQISVLIKHPTLSLEDRLRLFSSSSYGGRETMLIFLRRVLQFRIDEEGSEYVNVNDMDCNELEKYFNKYAVLPHTAWHIISNTIESYSYLMYHFSHWDRKLLLLL
eukprot:UN08566